jgi:hypothetical protein
MSAKTKAKGERLPLDATIRMLIDGNPHRSKRATISSAATRRSRYLGRSESM